MSIGTGPGRSMSAPVKAASDPVLVEGSTHVDAADPGVWLGRPDEGHPRAVGDRQIIRVRTTCREEALVFAANDSGAEQSHGQSTS